MGKSTISTGPFSIAFCMFTRPGKCLFFQRVWGRDTAHPPMSMLHFIMSLMRKQCPERRDLGWPPWPMSPVFGVGGSCDGIPRSHRNRSPVFVVLLSHCHVFSFFFFSVCSLFTPLYFLHIPFIHSQTHSDLSGLVFQRGSTSVV